MLLEESVTVLLVALALLFGALAVWAAWNLIETGRDSDKGAANAEEVKASSRAGHAGPPRVRICESQIHGGRRTPTVRSAAR